MQLMDASNGYWRFFANRERLCEIDPNDIGKWMVFYTPPQAKTIETLCCKAVEDEVCIEAKCIETNIIKDRGSGVACFYVHGHDVNANRMLVSWLFTNGLIRFSLHGKLQHISFKYDWQTRAGLYGDDFVAPMTSANFIDEQGKVKHS